MTLPFICFLIYTKNTKSNYAKHAWQAASEDFFGDGGEKSFLFDVSVEKNGQSSVIYSRRDQASEYLSQGIGIGAKLTGLGNDAAGAAKERSKLTDIDDDDGSDWIDHKVHDDRQKQHRKECVEIFALLQFQAAGAALIEAAVLQNEDIDREYKDGQKADQKEVNDLIDLVV